MLPKQGAVAAELGSHVTCSMDKVLLLLRKKERNTQHYVNKVCGCWGIEGGHLSTSQELSRKEQRDQINGWRTWTQPGLNLVYPYSTASIVLPSTWAALCRFLSFPAETSIECSPVACADDHRVNIPTQLISPCSRDSSKCEQERDLQQHIIR